MAQALVKHLTAQWIEIDGRLQPLFAGVFAIFGHGNVTCLGEALQETRDSLPTWRGQNEQSMGLAAVAYAKASRRRRIFIVTSSIGPGATNMVTAAAVAHVNRLPVLFLSGDVYQHRLVLVGDGSYLMLNSDIYSSVLSGRKLIVIVCDNGGFAVIDKLQRNTGNLSFNNLIADCRRAIEPFSVDFTAHARAMGARAESVTSIAEFEQAFRRAQECQRTYVIEVKIDPYTWTEEGNPWWEVGMPEVSNRIEVLAAAAAINRGRERQRRGV